MYQNGTTHRINGKYAKKEVCEGWSHASEKFSKNIEPDAIDVEEVKLRLNKLDDV